MPLANAQRLGCKPEEVSYLFPTVLLRRRMPDAVSKNRRLRKIILDRERVDPGVRQSNVGGWHSTPDLWGWPNSEIRNLCKFVQRAAADLTATTAPVRPGDKIRAIPFGGAWANVLRSGGYNKVHNHPGAVWSAVYYIASGDPFPEPKGNGNIEFMDPRPGNLHGGKEIVLPQSGLLLGFIITSIPITEKGSGFRSPGTLMRRSFVKLSRGVQIYYQRAAILLGTVCPYGWESQRS